MRKLRAVLFFIIFSLAAAEVLSAQGSGLVTVWSFTDELDHMINNYFRRDNRAIYIDYLAIPIESFPDRLDRALPLTRGAPDVFTLDSAFVRKYVESDLLMDLSDIFRENRDRLLTYPVDIGTHNGRVYALSWQACPGAMFYRRSLAKKYLGTDDPQAVQAYFSDLNKMMETAALLKDKSSGSCVLVSSREDLYMPFLYARASPWVVDGQLVIDPAMEQYIDAGKTLYDKDMTSRVGQWSEGWFAGMRDELRDWGGNKLEVFSYFLPTWGLHSVLKKNAAKTAGDWAIIPGPVPYRWGGTWIGANKNSQNSSAIKEFIRYITTNDSFLERYALDTGEFVTSLPVIQEVKDRYNDPFLGGQNHYEVFAEIAKGVNGHLEQATDTAIESIFKEAVTSYMYGERNRYQTLADIKRQVQARLGL